MATKKPSKPDTRKKEPGRQRRPTGSPAEMPKRMRETRLRQRY